MKKAVVSILLLIALMFVVSCGQEESKAAEQAPKAEETVSKVEVLKETVDSYFANMPDHIYKISQKEFVDMVRAGEDMLVLDIRQAADYDKGHVKGIEIDACREEAGFDIQRLPGLLDGDG